MENFERLEIMSDRLRKALARSNMKQTELCDRTGIDKGAMSSYVSGRYGAKQDRINKIAEVLDVNSAWLMGYDVPMEREKNTPDKIVLTEGEEMLLDLFRRVPVERQQMVLDMIKIALKQTQ